MAMTMTRRAGVATCYATIPVLDDAEEMERRAMERARRLFGDAPLTVATIRVCSANADGSARFVQYAITKGRERAAAERG
jgi:hypothetical protein